MSGRIHTLPQVHSTRLVRSVPTFSLSLNAIMAALHGLRGGTLTVRLPDGRALEFGDGAGNAATIVVNDVAFARAVFVTGDIGFAEGYIDGLWDTPDLFALLTLLCDNGDRIERFIKGNTIGKVIGRMMHVGRANTRAGSRRNILAHYDLGNAFYEAWLDPGMTYSAAKFSPETQSLEDAQAAKYRAMARLVDLQAGEHVLEIGCGWGGFAQFAAREIGARVTALTISDAQYDYASARIQRAGLADLVEVRRQDYRDVDGQFDKVVSIEMFEAVGEAYWPAFFGQVAARLRPGGAAGLQIITVRDDQFESYRSRVDFIQRYVFPGGMLPSMQALKRETAGAGLRIVEEMHAGDDYHRTLRVWADSFSQNWPEIRAQGFDERFGRFWQFYLAYCAAGFATERTDLVRLAVRAT